MTDMRPVPAERLDAIVKAYDIRGTVPDQLDLETCRTFGGAFAKFVDAPTIVVGRDMRPDGVEFARAFGDGAMSRGVDVIDIGLASTDMLYFASGHLDMPGAMFTASHNPAGYNGIKLCGSAAKPIGMNSGLAEIRATAEAGFGTTGRGTRRELDLLSEFVDHVHSFIDITALRPLTIVADVANGMGGYVAPAVFAALDVDVEIMYGELDGTFPNHPADPIRPENLVDVKARVLEVGADIGLAFDGDADRVFLIDENARAVSGSLTTALVAKAMLERSGPGPVIHNLICSKATAEVIREHGGEPVRTKVGHSFIKAVMAETDAVFGGEHSGHYYFRDNWRADSGLIATMIVLEELSKTDKSLSEMLAPLDRYAASGEINTRVDDVETVIDRVSKRFSACTQDRLDGLTVDCGQWWFNLRPSNTEPLLRLNLEAANKEEVDIRVAEVMANF